MSFFFRPRASLSTSFFSAFTDGSISCYFCGISDRIRSIRHICPVPSLSVVSSLRVVISWAMRVRIWQSMMPRDPFVKNEAGKIVELFQNLNTLWRPDPQS
ncbi:PREDICTED: uncharacterized protein LOC104807930 isoform X2 [Tarenaya hassleriana]|uniref:uncharacterized protein LOC104807930 isoform X2 n=1 Tax=Tarenaya hassleriana TaxID=28532 RepID=UPI00053C5971|nr:PREDICTED: uncharacterized protein LOC104807930 isoform X2 [Tarenaya hassleriana]